MGDGVFQRDGGAVWGEAGGDRLVVVCGLWGYAGL